MKTTKRSTERNEVRHTPTPWVNYGRFIRLNNDVHIAQTEIDSDTAFIVRAVNSHEALLKACKEALAFVPGEQRTFELLRLAIAQAEGK